MGSGLKVRQSAMDVRGARCPSLFCHLRSFGIETSSLQRIALGNEQPSHESPRSVTTCVFCSNLMILSHRMGSERVWC